MAKKSVKKRTPRRIAGVKLPKPVRRGLDELMASKTGRAIVADAVLAAGAVLLATRAKKKPAARKALGKHGPEDGLAAAAAGGTALSQALGEAGRTFIDVLQRAKAEADARIAWPPVAEIKPKAKPTKAPPAH